MIQKHTVEITSEKDENDNLHMHITGNGVKEEISGIIDIQQQNLKTTKEAEAPGNRMSKLPREWGMQIWGHLLV